MSEQTKAFQFLSGGRLTPKMLMVPAPTPSQPRSTSVGADCQFRSLDGTLKNAKLMAEREDLKLQRCAAPERSQECSQKGGQQVAAGELKENRWSRGVTRWFRWSLSDADPFVCRCLTNSILLRFHNPLIEPDMRN